MSFLVQSAHTVASPNCAFTGNVVVGDMLIVVAQIQALSAVFACSDTLGNVYLPITPRVSGNMMAQMFIAIAVVAGPNVITIANSGLGGNPTAIAVQEFATVIAIDMDAFSVGTGNAQSPGQITARQPYSILFSYEAGSAPGQTSVTPSPGWTQIENINLGGGQLLTQYLVAPTPGFFTAPTTTLTQKAQTNSWVAEAISLFNPNSQVGEIHKNNIAYPPAKQPGGLGTPVTDPKQQLGSTSPNKPDILFPMNEYTGRFRAGCGHSFNNFEVLKEAVNGIPSALIVCPLCKYVTRIVTPYDLIQDNTAFAQIIG